MKLFKSISLIGSLLFFCEMATADFAPREIPRIAAPNAEQTAQLNDGKAITSTKRATFNRGEVYGLIDAPPAKVWAIVSDYNKMKSWYPDMLESITLKREGKSGTLQGLIKMPLVFANRSYQLEAVYQETTIDGVPAYTIEFNYLPGYGNLKDMYGYWLIYENPLKRGQTVVKYVINVDLGVWLPDFILRWAQGRMLPGIITGIRSQLK